MSSSYSRTSKQNIHQNYKMFGCFFFFIFGSFDLLTPEDMVQMTSHFQETFL